MTRIRIPVLLAFVGTLLWLAVDGTENQVRLVRAEGLPKALDDADGDLVPDSVEWMLQTNKDESDSDEDGVCDFVEIVNFKERASGKTELAADHRIRLLITSSPDQSDGSKSSKVWLHVLFNYVGSEAQRVVFNDLFLEKKGKRVSLVPVIGYGKIDIKQRYDRKFGTLCRVSCEIRDEKTVRALLPCTFGVTATFDSTRITTGSLLVGTGGITSALVPVGDNRFMVHPINTSFRVSLPDPGWKGGKTCVLKLATVGNSQFGRVCEVIDADCEAAAGLRCSTDCPKEEGNILYVPTGMDVVLGG